jgi:hypothetical protein
MPESPSHKRAKSKAPGKTEVRVRGGGRVDSATPKTATQVERNQSNLRNSVAKLKASGRPRRVLQVPQHLMNYASAEMRKQNVSGTVKNMSGTKRRSIRTK